MAERLTKEYYYTWDENGTKKLSYIQKLQNKLGKLEDIMEKYSIESVEELDKKIADSDTWQKACELACENMKLPVDILIGNKEFNECHSIVDYFYQQAKKGKGE